MYIVVVRKKERNKDKMISEVVMSTTMVHLSEKMRIGMQSRSPVGESRGRRSTNILTIKSEMAKPATYSSSFSTNIMIPLHESPTASLDQYLEDKPRLFKAMFPEKGKSKRINEDVWSIQMLPIDIPMMTVSPVVDMRVINKSGGIDYPPEVPRHVTKLVELDITRWDMQGLEKILKPCEFALGVKGFFYPDRRGPRTRLKGQFQMSVSFVFPHVFALIPEYLRQNVADSILDGLMVNMKHRINRNLLDGYNEFKKEELN